MNRLITPCCIYCYSLELKDNKNGFQNLKTFHKLFENQCGFSFPLCRIKIKNPKMCRRKNHMSYI